MAKRTHPSLQLPLVKWFRKNQRDLPWRKTQAPYPVWISEIMLQQTQVNTVIPYYNRWMKNFPTVQSLAQAPLSKVLKGWEGLGYYSRARNLHNAAKIIARKNHGVFPQTAEVWQELPGVGRYTAGAITSIAFNHPEPILDGNVKRVLSRIFAVKKPVDTSTGEKKLWMIAEKLVKELYVRHCEEAVRPTKQSECLIASASYGALPRNDNIGDFNQSLMELGATICLPENPQCSICPVENFCRAHRLKKETFFPIKLRKQKLEKLRTVAAVIWKKNRILLQKRPLNARWGGLWAFPHWVSKNGKKDLEFLTGQVRKDFGIEIKDWRNHSEIRHGFTKYDVRLQVYEGTVFARSSEGATKQSRQIASPRFAGLAMTRWTPPQKLSSLALPRPHQKIAELIQSHA